MLSQGVHCPYLCHRNNIRILRDVVSASLLLLLLPVDTEEEIISKNDYIKGVT